MAKINLLPWRQELRTQRQREFYVMMGVFVVAGVVAVLLWHTSLAARISEQDTRVAYIRTEITDMDKNIKSIDEIQKKKDELLARMKVIQDLQGRRPVIVRIFDEFVRTLPAGVYFESLKREGDVFRITGIAESNNQVSNLMRNLEASPWFMNPELSRVRADEKALAQKTAAASAARPGQSGEAAPNEVRSNTFELTVKLESQEKPQEGKKEGAK